MRGRRRHARVARAVTVLTGVMGALLIPSTVQAAPALDLPSVPPVLSLPSLPAPSAIVPSVVSAPVSVLATTVQRVTEAVPSLLTPPTTPPPSGPSRAPGPLSTAPPTPPTPAPAVAASTAVAPSPAAPPASRQQPGAVVTRPQPPSSGPPRPSKPGRTGAARPRAAVVDQIMTAGRRAAVPLALVGLLVGFLALQGALDRRDGRLASAPLRADRGLEFGEA